MQHVIQLVFLDRSLHVQIAPSGLVVLGPNRAKILPPCSVMSRPGRPGVATRREQVHLSARFTKANALAHVGSLVHTLSDESAATPRSILTPEASILLPQSVIVDPPRVIRSTPLDPSQSFWGACGLLAD